MLRIPTAVAAVLLGAVILSGCASAPPTESTDVSADVDTAQATIQPYLDGPAAFPVTEPLTVSPAGKRVALIDCGSPVCGLFADLMAAPAEALGFEITRVEAGTSADGVATAFDTVLEGGFDGVFVPALAPSLWATQLEELNAAGIAVVTSGVIGLEPDTVGVALASERSAALQGELLASWVVAENADASDVVLFTTPQISFTGVIGESFTTTMSDLCPECAVRLVDIPVTDFGSRAPQIVVDDLLAHPNTTTAVFALGEQAIGLAPALATADLGDVQILLSSPDPSVLAEIQNGTFDAGLGLDFAVLTWTVADSLARLMTDQPVSAGAAADGVVFQLLDQEDLPGDVSRGWTGYPDFADRFLELWSSAS